MNNRIPYYQFILHYIYGHDKSMKRDTRVCFKHIPSSEMYSLVDFSTDLDESNGTLWLHIASGVEDGVTLDDMCKFTTKAIEDGTLIDLDKTDVCLRSATSVGKEFEFTGANDREITGDTIVFGIK